MFAHPMFAAAGETVLEDLDTLSLIPRDQLVSIFEGAGRNCDTAVIDKIYKVCSPML